MPEDLSVTASSNDWWQKSLFCDHDAIESTLSNLLSEAFDGSRGQPTNFVDDEPHRGLLGTLDGLSAQQASWAAASGRRTIAAHVNHLAFGFATTVRWLRGNRDTVDWTQSWRGGAVTDEQWDGVRADLRRRYADMSEVIRSTREWNAENVTAIAGQIAHAAYHLGAVRQIMASLAQDRDASAAR